MTRKPPSATIAQTPRGFAMSVFLSAGHSQSDPGAVANGRKEAEVAVEFRNMVSHYLTEWGFQVVTDGAGKENLPLKYAAAEAKRHEQALEFHLNAAANTSATGVETLSGPEDMALGANICDAIANALKIKNRGAKPENAGQHHRLAFVQSGGIIVELFFLTNPNDLAAYDARKWLAAKAVAEAIRDDLRA